MPPGPLPETVLEVHALAQQAEGTPQPLFLATQGVPEGAGNRRPAPNTALPPQLRPAELLVWLLVAAVQPCFVALLGVLTRYLEVKTTPGVPPLRVTCQIVLFSVPVLFLFYSCPRWLYLRRQRAKELQQGKAPGTGLEKGSCTPASTSSSSIAAADEEDASVNRPEAVAVAGLARVPTLPGLSRVYDRHPGVHRVFVLLAVATSYLCVILMLNFAPLMLDPSIIMLITLFTVVGVALVGRIWLHLPLPGALPVAAVAMIGGAAMVVVPSALSKSADTPGSLTTARAWLGFGLSIGAVFFTIMYLTLLQAFKHAKLGAEEVMYWLSGLCALVVLPISLAVDGTDWAAQFRSFDSSDWGALLFCALVAHNGSVLAVQWATLKLGGNVVAMTFGLRLIASIAASKVLLGATVIQTGVQIAGVVIVALSITIYMALQWWEARRRQLQALKN